MKRTIRISLFVAMLSSLAGLARAQAVLGVDGGVVLSTQHASQINLLPEGKLSPSAGLAIEYLEIPHLSLRTGLGYKAVGGKDTQNVPFTSKQGGRQANETFHILQLNTVIRSGFRFGGAEFYLGVGPKVDFQLSGSTFKEPLFSDYKVKRAILGFRYEVGFDYWFSQDRFKIGVMALMEHDVTAFAKANRNEIFNQTYGLQLSFGYRFGGKSKSVAESAD